MRLMVRMKTKQQLVDEGYFEDGYKDFWKKRENYDNWDNSLNSEDVNLKCVFADDFGKIINYHDEYKTPIENMKWGIAEIFPKKDFPEYYL